MMSPITHFAHSGLNLEQKSLKSDFLVLRLSKRSSHGGRTSIRNYVGVTEILKVHEIINLLQLNTNYFVNKEMLL